MERKTLRDRFTQFSNWFLGREPQLLNSADAAEKAENHDKMVQFEEYIKPKDEIEYWKREIKKYKEFINNESKRLESNISSNNMTPKKYDRLIEGIDRAIYNLDFAQKSLEKLLIVKAVTPEQVQKVKATTITGLNRQLSNRDNTIKKYTQLENNVQIYKTKDSINNIVKKLMIVKDNKTADELYEQLKQQYSLLKQSYKSIGIDKDYELETENYELFSKNNNFRKSFLEKSQKENSELLEQIQKDSESTLKIKGKHSAEFIQKTIQKRVSKKQDEISDISKRLELISNSSDQKIMDMTILGLYGQLYDQSEKRAANIDFAKKKGYTLSNNLENTINENISKSKSGLVKSVKSIFSKEAKQEKLELVFAMYPFLRGEENKDKLSQYLKENKTFVDRLVSSGITPEQIISEKERLNYIRNAQLSSIVKNSKKVKNINDSPKLQYQFSKESLKLTLTGNQIENIKQLPVAENGEKKQSYISRILEQMKSASQGHKEITEENETTKSDKPVLKYKFENNKNSKKQKLSNTKNRIHSLWNKIKESLDYEVEYYDDEEENDEYENNEDTIEDNNLSPITESKKVAKKQPADIPISRTSSAVNVSKLMDEQKKSASNKTAKKQPADIPISRASSAVNVSKLMDEQKKSASNKTSKKQPADIPISRTSSVVNVSKLMDEQKKSASNKTSKKQPADIPISRASSAVNVSKLIDEQKKSANNKTDNEKTDNHIRIDLDDIE